MVKIGENLCKKLEELDIAKWDKDRNFCSIELNESNLLRSYLDFTDLTGSKLRGSKFIGSDFSGSDLTGSFLRTCDLTGSDLRKSKLKSIKLDRGCKIVTRETGEDDEYGEYEIVDIVCEKI